MAKTTAEFLLERLHENGVRRIYGYPGDGINAIVGALEKFTDKIEFVQVRHEEMAAFMACAHAKWTGEVGVCLATSGPGAIHLLNGLYDAKLDHAPVLAIVGQQARSALGGSYQQEVDLQSLFKDVAHEYCEMATDPAQIRHLVDRGHRIALDQRSVTCIIIPNDLGEEPAVPDPPHKHGTIHSSPGWARPRIVPDDADLKRAAEILNAGEQVAILVGQGALGAHEEVMQIAEKLGAGVAKALLGGTVIDDSCRTAPAPSDCSGTKPSWTLMNECDTLLMVGSSFPYSEFLPEPGKARGVQIDLDGRMLNIRYPMELGLIGDAKQTLAKLIPLVQHKTERKWRQQLEGEIEDWWRLIEDRALAGRGPDQPAAALLGAEQVPAGRRDRGGRSGTSADWFARVLKLRPVAPGVAFGDARDDGPRCAVRDRGEVRASEPACDRARRRRRDADERHGGADHRGEVLRPLGRPTPHRPGTQQPRPEPGDVGAARDGGRPEESARRRRSPTCVTRSSRG